MEFPFWWNFRSRDYEFLDLVCKKETRQDTTGRIDQSQKFLQKKKYPYHQNLANRELIGVAFITL